MGGGLDRLLCYSWTVSVLVLGWWSRKKLNFPDKVFLPVG